MADGGFDPVDPTEKTPLIPDKGDDDGDDSGTVNPGMNWDDIDMNIPIDPHRTQTSTPAGEQVPMSTRTRLPPEQQGSHTEETSFITGDTQGRRVITSDTPPEQTSIDELLYPEDQQSLLKVDIDRLKRFYPQLDESQKPLFRGKNPKNIGELVAPGKGKGTEIRVFNKDGTLNQTFVRTNKAWLGPPAEELITESAKALSSTRMELRNAEQDESRLVSQRQQATNEVTDLSNRLEKTRARITALEEGPDSIKEHRAEIERLKTVERNLQADLKNQEKEVAALEKQRKTQEKKVANLKEKVATKTQERNNLQAGLDSTKPLDELKQQAEELDTKIQEDKNVIEDENTSSSERNAAEARVAENEAELERLNEEIEARERQSPLLERVKDIFKKYGWTLQAVVLAVGLVLSALALAGMNGLKAGTKALGQGLKAIGQKLGSLLPGLIGSIVSYIFKAAGSVLSFLAEHAWLLILAVVAFFMERLLKKKRKQ